MMATPTNKLQSGMAFLSTQLTKHASQTVTYSRDADSVDVHATYGKKLLKLADGMGGFRMEWTDMDFLIPAADLVLNGSLITPLRGDLIHISQGGQVQTFEVFPYGSEPPWRWSDPYQLTARIHAKHVGTEVIT